MANGKLSTPLGAEGIMRQAGAAALQGELKSQSPKAYPAN
jgi:hypothetical protein